MHVTRRTTAPRMTQKNMKTDYKIVNLTYNEITNHFLCARRDTILLQFSTKDIIYIYNYHRYLCLYPSCEELLKTREKYPVKYAHSSVSLQLNLKLK